MTLLRRLVLGLGLVLVIAAVAHVAWKARPPPAASTSARSRPSPSAVPSHAPAPSPTAPRATQPSASASPSQPAPAEPPLARSAPTAPDPGITSPLERTSPAVDQALSEPHPAEIPEIPGKAVAAPRRARRADPPSFQRRLQPGLCVDPREAAQIRETLIARFRHESWGGAGRLYVDPRLPEGAHLPLLSHLELAEREVYLQLRLEPQRPDVFAYLDATLLVSAACTNPAVVAYYDGALHVVVTHDDVQTSVLHEYTHHALMSQGILGPAWAQEGIAMLVAREEWWLDPARLDRVREAPMSFEVMEEAIPYTLLPDEAVLFYVQAASMVACIVRDDGAGLRGLVGALGAAAGGAQENPSLAPSQLLEPSTWRGCIDGLMRSAGLTR